MAAGDDFDHAFVVAHRKRLGRNHEDDFFGSSCDASASTLQGPFPATLQAGGASFTFRGMTPCTTGRR